MYPKIVIVILNWNGWSDTIECLASLLFLERQNFAVVVVDNDSTDSSVEKLLEWENNQNSGFKFGGVINENDAYRPFEKSELVYVQANCNNGFSAGNNIGIRLALQSGCDYVWLLNNDTVVVPTSLVALEERVARDPKIGMCGSILRYYDDRNQIQAVGGCQFNFLIASGGQLGHGLRADDKQIAELAEISPTYVSGASLFVSSSFLRDVGLMEESYFLYYEEIDWAVRAASRWRTATAVASIVFHKEGSSIGTTSRGRRSTRAQYYLSRNVIRFYALRKPWLLPVAVLRVMYEALGLGIKHHDYHLAITTIKGLIDGVLVRTGQRVE
jgi:GT2 family glycosyltransferase